MTLTTLPSAVTAPAVSESAEPLLRSSHTWRTLLESRWNERLIAVITLSLAYTDAADRSSRGDTRQVRRLMAEAVAARRALSDTEDALARLSAGRFGRCEQCVATIPADYLARAPETRYCPGCEPAGFTGLRAPADGRQQEDTWATMT